MRKFQQLVLLLDPMLQASFHLISLYLPYALNNFTHSDLDYFYHVLSDPDLQGEVDAVNARVAERLKKKGRKDLKWERGSWYLYLVLGCVVSVFDTILCTDLLLEQPHVSTVFKYQTTSAMVFPKKDQRADDEDAWDSSSASSDD